MGTVRTQLTDDFNWDKGVFHQTWPQLDQTTNLELKVLANNKALAKISVAKWYFDTLTEDQAFDLACHENTIQDNVLPYHINSKTFSKAEEFEKKKKADKLAKKQEKLAKKAAKVERTRVYKENVARREKITKSNKNNSE